LDTRLTILAAALVAMTLATPAMAQKATIDSIDSSYYAAKITVNPTANWDAAQGVWRVSYSVNVDLPRARIYAGEFGQAAVDELNANIAKYERAGGPWYQMRYANTYKTNSTGCEVENPAAYNSEMIGGTGWYRSFLVAPEEATCLTVWMYGDNVFSPKGHPYGSGGIFPLGGAWFRGPPRPP